MIATQGHQDQCIRIHKYVPVVVSNVRIRINSLIEANGIFSIQTTAIGMSNDVVLGYVRSFGDGICTAHRQKSDCNQVDARTRIIGQHHSILCSLP